jgi:hypothetical protein
MRIRRTILAPVILAIGTAGSLVAVPALAVATPATSALTTFHASVHSPAPNLTTFHA